MYLQLIPFIALAAAIPYPLPNNTYFHSLQPRAAKCSTPGAFVCKGSNMQGMCNMDGTVHFMPVAAGTICTCSDGQCEIIASDSSMPSASASATAVPSGASPTVPSGSSPTGDSPTGHSAHPKHSKKPGSSVVPVPSHSKLAGSTSSPTAAPSGSAKPKHSVPSASASSPSAPSASPSSPVTGGGSYKFYQGDGSVADGWPAQSDWLSFDALWASYEKEIGANCETAFQVPNNTPEETADIKKSLLSVSQAAGIPAEFSLAIMMQESLGCAHVQTTNFGVSNPGLFQDHDGKGTCQNTPTCPASEIEQMCKDGIQGTTAGPGLQQLVKQAGSSGAETYYRAARLYNSGSIAADGNLGEGIATHCYCSDIANRITGQWFSGTSSCTLD